MAKIIFLLSVVILIIMIPSVTLLWENQQRTILEQAHIRAQAIHQMIVVTRQWVAENRDRIEPVPAVATKELSRYADNMASFRFHITSDKLINPENAPSPFEIEAMHEMKDNMKNEYSKVASDPELGNVYMYAAPLYINEWCLSCHRHQDYRVNDFRGLISITFSLEEIEKTMAASSKIVIYTIIVGFVSILAVICFLIYWLIVRHIRTLTNATDAIGRGSRVRTDITTDDEIETLSKAFDQMSAQIASNDEIMKARLSEAVSKYIAAVNELERKNKTLGSLNQLKTDLLDSVSHEIRTPLTKILSYSELLNDSRILQNDEVRTKFASSMKNNINAIKNMFNDIITLSRLEHEQHVYHKIPVNIREMASEISELFDLEIKAKNLELAIEINENDVIYVDGETFSSVMSNIISNAVKYSRQNGKILLKAGIEGDSYSISCTDHGVGIPEEDIDKVFVRFHRGSNVKKEFPGTGLGLSIVVRIIKAHKGSMNLESSLGEYTKITITLPLSEVGGDKPAVKESEESL